MVEAEDTSELLFFDTFSHETDTDINLDLVQFPKPVYITQVRIIPLGARVQADFPGGVRLGATNPSKFDIEFFVNDLGMPGASTFENLGNLQYNQNDCIHLECNQDKIPTDGLVLRGWYSTITLAVYGILTNALTENIASPPPMPNEPEILDEVTNASAANNNSNNNNNNNNVMAETVTKEDWKELMPLEVTQTNLTPTASDFNLEDGEYSAVRGHTSETHHHHHTSSDERDRERERERERERRLRKSSEHSPSTRHRTHSESNEREYVRSKEREREREREPRDKPRDWSRSPEYSRHSRHKKSDRSRSDIEESGSHKRAPRTPPRVTLESPPPRPNSPDYSDEDNAATPPTSGGGSGGRYKHSKPHSFRRSSDSLNQSRGDTGDVRIMDDEDINRDTPVEQYEPILSDDEMIGDDGDDDSTILEDINNSAELEAELQAAALSANPAILDFDPYQQPLQKFPCSPHEYYGKDVENLQILLKKFLKETKCQSLEVYIARSKSTVATTNSGGVGEEKESFIFLCEQLIQQLTFLTQNLKRRNYVLTQLCKDKDYVECLYQILFIALNFEAACAHGQPVFITRHIKTGAKLMELLAPSRELFDYLWLEKKYDPFKSLMSLLEQNFMAVPIKLLLLKAIYSLLDCPTALKHFLGPQWHGYRLLLDLMQNTRLTRTKYALQALIKKLNLNEALANIRETCTQLFVLSNYKPTNMEPYQMLDHCLRQLVDAVKENTLSYQQLRRFLPVSKKFEISIDVNAQRSFANGLQAYFQQYCLGESLLLLISNASSLPSYLLLSTLDLLQTLIQTPVGLDYLMDDCFEVTQLIVATLLGINRLPEREDVETGNDQDNKVFNIKKELEDDAEKDEEKPPKLEEGPKQLDMEKNVEGKNENVQESKEEIKVDNKPGDQQDVKVESIANNTKSPANAHTDTAPEPMEKKSSSSPPESLQKLGREIAYKMKTRYHLEAIIYYSTICSEYNSLELTDHLHAIYSQTCNAWGRHYTVEILGINNNVQIFLNLIEKEQHQQAQWQLVSPGSKYKSPVLSYAVDMVDCCVRYCNSLEYLVEHGRHILALAKNHENFEPSVSAVLQELFVYVKPLEVINIFGYGDITALVEVITRSLEYVTTFPGDLIMGLRILRHLSLPPFPDTAAQMFKSGDTQELKYRFVALQFYAADGLQTLMQILEKLYTYFEQPGLHAPTLRTIQGLHCCQIILPTLQIMREMLSFAIQCRDVYFKDLSAIDHLMRTYFLLHYFPNALERQAVIEVNLAKREIIQTFLAYTQPNEQDEESLHKSLWTLMIREILKNIDGPSTFMPGLVVLAELLPLPLPAPLPTDNADINAYTLKTQAQRLITERKLWSAHLHPQSLQIARLVENIVPTSFSPLSDLLERVCLQLADLAPNMTLLITKTLSDLLITEWFNNHQQPNGSLARLLQFYSRLNANASVKISTLSILSGKLWDVLQGVLNSKANTEIHIKCQVSVHRLLESFLDTEISLIASSHLFGSNSQSTNSKAAFNLASALPPKELIPKIAEAIFNNLIEVEITHEISALGVRNLVILTEHDITFYHLSSVLRQHPVEFQQWMLKIIELNERGSYNSNIESLILLLRSLTQLEEANQSYATLPIRTLKLNAKEFATLMGHIASAINDTTDTTPPLTTTTAEDNTSQFDLIQRIANILKEHKEEVNDTLFNDVQQLQDLLATVEAQATITGHADSIEKENMVEPMLPQTESIVTQYDARPIFCTYEPQADDEQMSATYWLNTFNVEDISEEEIVNQQNERITCDLIELAKTCLSLETNLTLDCKRVLHLSASPQSNRERTPTAPCFRTRRVEVEPSTGRPEKKLFITSMRGRGFGRPAPIRGDLFRSRPPNTSRPPSLHVDDFLALETCGAQPTGPTGYNKIPPLMRGSRVGRNRGSRIAAVVAYRKAKLMRTASPSTWSDSGSPHTTHFTPSSGGEVVTHYSTPHYISRLRGRGGRPRPYLR